VTSLNKRSYVLVRVAVTSCGNIPVKMLCTRTRTPTNKIECVKMLNIARADAWQALHSQSCSTPSGKTKTKTARQRSVTNVTSRFQYPAYLISVLITVSIPVRFEFKLHARAHLLGLRRCMAGKVFPKDAAVQAGILHATQRRCFRVAGSLH